jgi:GDP-L-fucose synthase
MIDKKDKIFVTGHKGLVGSAVVRRLNHHGYKNILIVDKKKLDLRRQQPVFNFFKKNKIDAVVNAAGTVGGIYANDNYKADFIYDNLSIQNNIIHSCYQTKVKSLIFLGSSCIYPRNSKQPIKEKYLLTGELEKTNEPYAIAKIAGIKMCESYNFQYKTNYKCLMPCNLYGPNDNYNPKTSHFFPALIAKAILAKKNKIKKIVLWGSGKPKRELMYVDDLADACIYFMNKKTN